MGQADRQKTKKWLLMKITAGELKSREIFTLKHLRLVESRIREVLSGLLSDEVRGKDVLDLFAGAGSLGIEALSWGAGKSWFVDRDKRQVFLVRKNLSGLGLLSKAEVYSKDAFSAVEYFQRTGKKFSLIFLDPPYNQGQLTKSLKTLSAYDILEPSGFIVSLGFYKEDAECENLPCVFDRKYGDRRVKMFKKSAVKK